LYLFDFYKCDLTYIRKATYSISYENIIDIIIELGIKHRFAEQLIMILMEKDIDIYKASDYLEKNREKYEKTTFLNVVPKLIHQIYEKTKKKMI
jgi:hypothetical protein